MKYFRKSLKAIVKEAVRGTETPNNALRAPMTPKDDTFSNHPGSPRLMRHRGSIRKARSPIDSISPKGSYRKQFQDSPNHDLKESKIMSATNLNNFNHNELRDDPFSEDDGQPR